MKIIWDTQVKQQLEDLFRFYQAMFGTKKAKSIVLSIKQHVLLLKQFPQLGPVEQDTIQRATPYRYLTKKYCKIYYLIESDYIYIALLWDTRRDPELLQKLLK